MPQRLRKQHNHYFSKIQGILMRGETGTIILILIEVQQTALKKQCIFKIMNSHFLKGLPIFGRYFYFEQFLH